mmetsp:Transcript_1923/g.2099  ORF Transcript_1923/g.2099 Transcript_1923/m.2099 type:complete len:324 (-) Transcript_1923:91-1062(-)
MYHLSISFMLSRFGSVYLHYGFFLSLALFSNRTHITQYNIQKLVETLKQEDKRGLKVDECLRVKGIQDGSVYAIGDAAITPMGLPPTAQVAQGQGKHLRRMFRDGVDRPFTYHHVGTLCCLGQGNAIAQLVAPKSQHASSINIWEMIGQPPAVGPNKDQVAVVGYPALAMWRSLYWSKLLTNNSRISLSMDWMKARINGRELVEPVLKRQPTSVNVNTINDNNPTTLATRNVECFGTPLRRNPTVIGFRRAGGNSRSGPFSSKPGLETDGADGKKRKWFNVEGTKNWFLGWFSTNKTVVGDNADVVDGNVVVVGKKKRFLGLF